MTQLKEMYEATSTAVAQASLCSKIVLILDKFASTLERYYFVDIGRELQCLRQNTGKYSAEIESQASFRATGRMEAQYQK